MEPGQDLIFYLVDQGAGEEAAAFGGGDTVYPNLSQVVLTADNRVAAGDVVVIQPVPQCGGAVAQLAGFDVQRGGVVQSGRLGEKQLVLVRYTAAVQLAVERESILYRLSQAS